MNKEILVRFPSDEDLPLEYGVTYKLYANLFEPPIEINGVQWARTNLSYNSSLVEPHHFRYDNNYAEGINNEFWRPGATIASDSSDTYTYKQGYPCSEVFPKGRWRNPTEGDITSLIFAGGTYKVTSINAINRYAVHWTSTTKAVTGFNETDLIFSMVGNQELIDNTLNKNTNNFMGDYWYSLSSPNNYVNFNITPQSSAYNTQITKMTDGNTSQLKHYRCIRVN